MAIRGNKKAIRNMGSRGANTGMSSGNGASPHSHMIGSKVTFVPNNSYIPQYYVNHNGIPNHMLLVHGSTQLYSGDYNAMVMDAHEDFLIIQYTDVNGKRVQLGFRPDAITDYKKQNMLDLAQLESLIIAEEVKAEICAVLKQHNNYQRLFEDWGLGEVIEYGKGMTFLFYGQPGTGKTWAAHCIAKALGTTLLNMSAAEIQSSEPGGANRAIQSAFAEATSSGKVLFIDECDSLITSRADLGMVLAGEVNTLLTEIEKFEGVAVLATNRVEHMDEALERRISLLVEFPYPKQPERLAIWHRLLPTKMPLGSDVDVDEMSNEKLTGGQIKNVILAAARLALSIDDDRVRKDHFSAAIRRVVASKNLLGTASTYHQVRVRDVDAGSGVGKSKSDDVDVDVDIDVETEPTKGRGKRDKVAA